MAFAQGRLAAAARALDTRPLLRQIGIGLMLFLSGAFLISAFRNAGSAAILARLDPTASGVILLAGILYGALLILLARGWSLVAAGPEVPWISALAVYGTSILPKYLPGSVFQYGSRQALGHRLGWDSGAMARASALEVILHVSCSLAVAVTVLLVVGEARQLFALGGWTLVLVATLLAALASMGWLSRQQRPSALVKSASYQLLFFTGTAALAGLCAAAFGVEQTHLLAVGGLFLLSWLIGLLVPLAPGGLGVREASGVALLATIVPVEAALLILAAMRLVSLTGDALVFILGIACQRRLHLSR